MRGAVVRGVCGVWQGGSAPRDQHFTGDRVVVDQVWSTTDPTDFRAGGRTEVRGGEVPAGWRRGGEERRRRGAQGQG